MTLIVDKTGKDRWTWTIALGEGSYRFQGGFSTESDARTAGEEALHLVTSDATRSDDDE